MFYGLTMKFSIITINYNNLNGLKKTVESVLSQSFSDFEYIIVDGKSNDGSVEYLLGHQKEFSHLIIENDNGIYDAMNRGLMLASGDYVQFLNSGDYLSNNNILHELSSITSTNSDVDFFYSDVINNDTNSIHGYPQRLTFNYFFSQTINHQSTLFKRCLFQKYGFYSEQYKIVSDWEFYLKILFIHRCKYLWISNPIVVFDYSNGVSTSQSNSKLLHSERAAVLNELFPYFIPDYEYFRSLTESTSWKVIQFLVRIKLFYKKWLQ